jgi:hypothetical protein
VGAVDKWLEEREMLERIAGKYPTDVLYNPEVKERHFETEEHDLLIVKQGDTVISYLRHK